MLSNSILRQYSTYYLENENCGLSKSKVEEEKKTVKKVVKLKRGLSFNKKKRGLLVPSGSFLEHCASVILGTVNFIFFKPIDHCTCNLRSMNQFR